MSAAFLWIFLPALWGLTALILRRSGAALTLFSAALSFLLTWVAWQVPIDTSLELGFLSTRIASSFTLFGRALVFTDVERPILVLVFLANGLWLLGAYMARPTTIFTGASQVFVALLVAALAVEPFLYAALLIAIAILLSVPMLAPPGTSAGPGLLRYLVLQLFGVPFILFVGWLLTGVEASPSNLSLVLRAGILVGLGFAFLQAIFPFHSWIPMLAEESHPYVFGFLLFFLPATVSLFGLAFIDRYAWLRDTQLVYQMLLAVGAVVCLFGGLRAAAEDSLDRQMGYAFVAEIGATLLAFGLGGSQSVSLILALIFSRLFTPLLWSIALAGLWQAASGSLQLSDLSRIVRRHPVLLAGVLVGLYSMAGLPLSAGFAPKISLLLAIWERNPWVAFVALVGMIGLLIAFLRVLYTLLPFAISEELVAKESALLGSTADPMLPDQENPFTWLYLVLGGTIVLVMALFPQVIFGDLGSFTRIFPQILP